MAEASAFGAGLQGKADILSFSMAIHDLKSPLAIIAGQSKLLLAEKLGPTTPRQSEALSDVLTCCRKLEDGISVLLHSGSQPPSRLAPVLENADLAQCLRSICDSLLPAFEERSIRFARNVGEEPLSLPFDRSMISLVVTNLLENAMRFTPPGGEVNISLLPCFWERRTASMRPPVERRRSNRAAANAARVVVTDTGPGVASEFQQEIFEEFFTTAAPGLSSGTGLGLAIARSVVQAHGGKIWVDSTGDMGSSFYFLLPFSPPGACPGPVAARDANRGDL